MRIENAELNWFKLENLPSSKELYKIKQKKRKGGQIKDADKVVNCPILANEKLQYVYIHQKFRKSGSRISIRLSKMWKK